MKQQLQKCFVFAFLLFWAPFWTPYGTFFLASGAWVPSKRQGFLEPGGLEPPKVVSHPVWGHWRFRHIMFSRAGRLGPRRKRPSNMLAPGSGRQAIQKKAHRIDNHLGSATSQTQERKKEANKRITTTGSPTAAVWAQPTRLSFVWFRNHGKGSGEMSGHYKRIER